MSSTRSLQAKDGNSFTVYEVLPSEGQGNGAAIVVLQEIFGVNAHIRSVADGYARDGYFVVAPALFDRVQPGADLEYNPEGRELGRSIAGRLTVEGVLADIAASLEYARSQVSKHKVGIVGYCLGGSYAWLSATRLHPDAAVGYYGSQVVKHAEERPQAPVILHFGKEDKGIPLAGVESFQKSQPSVPVYLYDAGHGFNRQGSDSYVASAAELAKQRTLDFFQKYLVEG